MPSVANALKDAIVEWQAAGWTVQFKGHSTAILTSGHEFNHKPHIILTFVTCFSYFPIWLLLWALHEGEKRVSININSNGTVDWKWI